MENFEAKNALEQSLVAAQAGQIPGEQFMQLLLSEQVFMPIQDRHQIGGLQASTQAVPLTLDTGEGFEVIILFTSPERAKPFVCDYPGYEGGLLAEFSWVLEKLGHGYGISLNPGWEAGIDMTPEDLAGLAAL